MSPLGVIVWCTLGLDAPRGSQAASRRVRRRIHPRGYSGQGCSICRSPCHSVCGFLGVGAWVGFGLKCLMMGDQRLVLNHFQSSDWEVGQVVNNTQLVEHWKSTKCNHLLIPYFALTHIIGQISLRKKRTVCVNPKLTYRQFSLVIT